MSTLLLQLSLLSLLTSLVLNPTSALVITMVEGHSVHRIASRFRSQLVGRKFAASSPNFRFTEGAAAIDGRVLSRVEAVGKNLFAFFKNDGGDIAEEEEIVIHVHFGMSGAWAVFNAPIEEEPEVKPTTRLRLEEIAPAASNGSKYIAHLSAMTVQHGDLSLYSIKKESLGEDPLRSDANINLLFEKIRKSKKSIGQLVMDQSFFCGPGNIYRAEILFLAGVYPTTQGMELDRASFDKIWNASVKLLRRGYDTGSILTVDADLDPEVVARGERRYIYNKSTCARCGGRVSSWVMSGRTCYACESGNCQLKVKKLQSAPTAAEATVDTTTAKGKKASTKHQAKKQHVPFISHCAPIIFQQRLEQSGAEQLTISEIRSVMEQIIQVNNSNDTALPPKGARKSVHVEALNKLLSKKDKVRTIEAVTLSEPLPPPLISAEDAAREKAISGENRAVEHVAELSSEQAIKAISVTPLPSVAARRKRAENHGMEAGRKRRSYMSQERDTDGSSNKRRSKRKLNYDK
ncbi:hypothetical protein HJC23_008276 [Cyclotella cryptica]|uniref:DNA-(apurinic or apyrimidinic site) lyase n=1 Tax=Cyclotella cryptica TaxID=29204 RepID=A0ABD3PDW4_9STRA|eukprot:CCRYP_015918-RA/>CCRYP_015918-RA protein AED:0.29 eAED:0.29 QI:208/1/1/1/1/1/2/309/518